MTLKVFATGVCVLAAVCGCVPSTDLQPGQIGSYWSLNEDITPQAPLSQPGFGARKLPARWVIEQKPSVVWSTVSIVRAFDNMKLGVEDVRFAISPTHTDTLVKLIEDARQALEGFDELAEASAGGDRQMWSVKMARILVQMEGIARLASIEADPTGKAEDPAGIAAGPLLEAVAMYLNENAGGKILSELAPEEIDRLRTILAQIALRLGFDLAGKQMPSGLRQSAVEMMRQAERMEILEKSLAGFLLDQADQAQPAATEGEMSKIIRLASSWAPKGLKVLQQFMGQWDKMESMELEFRRLDDQPVVAISINVLPGKQVRLADVLIAQPAMVFTGSGRIVVLPSDPHTGETVISFEPIDGGSIELHYEGIIYNLVRLFAVPLANGQLRQIRVFVQPVKQGRQLVNVAMLSEAKADEKDPRRILTFQDVRTKRLMRGPFSVSSVTESEQQIFNYITPAKRYTYKRQKSAPAILTPRMASIPQ